VLADRLRRQLLGRCRLASLGIFAAEPLYAARGVHQALLAGKERMASRADFHVNVALVGRPGLKAVSAGALHLHRGIIGMNALTFLSLGHLLNLSCNLSIVGGFGRFSNSGTALAMGASPLSQSGSTAMPKG
jgi:hypothetical protein